MASNITVGILRALLTLDTAQFESGIRQAAGQSRKFQSELRSIGGNLQTIGTQWTAAITLPIVAAFGGAAKAAIDFESSFAGVRKTVNASQEQFAALSKTFLEMSTRMPINVNDLNRLGETAGALGIPTQRIAEFVETVAMVGATTNVASEQAATDIARIQNIFGAAGEATKLFASALVALGNDGASSESEILALATRIASAGNTVNMTQAQVLGFSAAIANVGMDAEAGGSAFSRVVLEMSQSVSAGGAQLAQFAQVAGMSSQQFATLFKTNAAGATQAFIEGLGRIKQGGGDLNATITNLGFTEIRQSDLLRRLAGDSAALSGTMGLANDSFQRGVALNDEYAKRNATTESSLIKLGNEFGKIGILFGTALLPVVTRFVDLFAQYLIPALETLVGWFVQLPEPLQMVAVGFAGLVAAAGPFLFLVSQIAMGVAALAGLGGFGMLTPVLAGVVTFFTTTLPAAFAVILPWLGPIGLIAAGVTAVVLAWKYWDNIVAFFQGAWQLVVQSIKMIPDILLPLLGPIGLVIAAFRHWDQISAIASAVYTAVKTWLVDKFASIVKWIGDKVGQVTGFFKNMYTAVVGQSYVPDMVTEIGSEFGRLDGLMVGPAQRSTSLVQDTFRSMADGVNNLVGDMLRRVSSMLTGWLDSFMPSWAAKLLGGIADSVIGGITQRLLPGISGMGGGGLLGNAGGMGVLGKIPGLSGLLGGGGSGALQAGAAINAQTAALGGSGAAGGGGGAMGFLTNPAFWTNPFTIAGIAGAALGLGIWKGGLFRGGEEALKVSPRRDKFFSQFGDVQNRGEGGAAWNLASKLVALGQGDGGGPMFAALQRADTVAMWESAQANVVALLKRTGMEVQSFARGGFIPPGVVTPAILHGGSQGEVIAPLDKMGNAVTLNVSINAVDAASVKGVMPLLIHEFKMALLFNQDGIVTAHRRALEA